MNGMYKAWEQWQGQVVNGVFPLVEYLGGGERSAVFLTEDTLRKNQKAAIKLVLEDSENAELQLSRWQLAADLSHPHLLGLFSMGRCQLGDRELLYLVMEYAEENLSQVLAQRPLTTEEARDMLEPVLDTLAFIHRKGFVHGDVKPTNIMAVDNQLKISSDALCRIGEPGEVRNQLAAYDPPEFAVGEMLPAGDVWSLGMTLVEVLTQRVPVWARAGRGEPDVPDSLPAPFLDVARHCLLRDPQRRCTVADITAELRQTSAPSTTDAPEKSFAKRRYIAPAAALALLLVAILVGPRLFKPGPGDQLPAGAVEQPKLPSRPALTPKTPKIEQSSRAASAEKAARSRTVPEPVRSESRAETPAAPRAPGKVLHQVLPDVPRSARETIQGKVRLRVKVRVAPSGSVTAATLEHPGPSRYFAKLALQAAHRWKFVPAKVDGSDVASEWVLRFEFGRSGTKVLPVQTVP